MVERADGLRFAVTGAAGGIGRAVCAELRARRAEVISLDLSVDGLAGEAHVLDVTDHVGVQAVFETIGLLDGLVLAHGLTALGTLGDVPMSAIERVININLTGTIAVTKAALDGLVERRGRIAVLSSVSGFAPLVNRTAYSASKHGLHGFFDSLRAEARGTGLSVTLVCPSFVRTGIEERAAHRAPGEDGSWSTTGRIISPEKLAGLIVSGMLDRRRLVLPTTTAKAAWVVSRLAPRLYERLMTRRIRAS